MKSSLTIVILAAGKGTRMKSSKPKVLHKIANKEMILHVIDVSKKLNPDNLYVVLGKKSDDIKRILPKNTGVIIQSNPLGTADALLCTKDKVLKKNGKLLVLYGDVPLLEHKTLKNLLKGANQNISMLGFESLLPKGYGRIIKVFKKVKKVVEQKDLNFEEKNIKLCYSGIFCGSVQTIFKLLNKVKKNKNQKEFLLTDIFSRASIENISISLVMADENEVMGVNNLLQLSKADDFFQKKLKENFLIKGVIIENPKSVYLSHDIKIDANVTIGPNNYFGEEVVIKKNCLIESNNNIKSTIINEGTSIGPFSRLRNNTVIGKNVKIGNYVEVKNSYIGNYSKINHLTYIGDAIVGAKTNIGAGTITCNYDGKKKYKTKIGNNVFVGSNCSLIAPIEIGNNAFVAAGSTISDDLNKNDFSIARAKQKIIKKASKRFLK